MTERCIMDRSMSKPLPMAAPKPPWLRVRIAGGERYGRIKQQRASLGLATVCEEARCPNIGECWSQGTATFMVLGSVCTRGCRFCAVTTQKTGLAPDPDEPTKLAETVAGMALDYAVWTMVDRDDLSDGGASHVAACVAACRERAPATKIELLTGDFLGDDAALRTIVGSGAAVLAHNLEVVRRLTPTIRDPRCGYDLSLDVLRRYRALAPAAVPTKSSLMVGLGETPDEVVEALRDLQDAGVAVVTIGQYLRPSAKHAAVEVYVPPEQFAAYERLGREIGFEAVFSGPLVRSSYRAAEVYLAARA